MPAFRFVFLQHRADPRRAAERRRQDPRDHRRVQRIRARRGAAPGRHHIAPGLTEHNSANVGHASQMVNAPAGVAPNSGSLYRPLTGGPERTGVDGRVRERVEREDAARKDGGK